MAVGMYFSPSSFTPDTYDAAIAQLEDAGAGSPEGRLFHVALSTDDGNVHVFDIWESEEQFRAFGAALMPILGELGVDPGEPQVMPVHNTVYG